MPRVITIGTAGPTGSVDESEVQEIIASSILEGDNVTIEDNGDGTITISSEGGGGGGGGYTLEQIQDIVATMIVAGSNITVNYNDPSDTLTISSAGDGLTSENVRDIIGTALVEGANIDITVNDSGDTITVAVTGLTISNISGLQTALDAKALDADLDTLSSTVSTLQSDVDTVETQVTNNSNTIAQHVASGNAHQASTIGYGGGTGMSATNVETAIDELATEKVDLSGDTMSGGLITTHASGFNVSNAFNGELDLHVKNTTPQIDFYSSSTHTHPTIAIRGDNGISLGAGNESTVDWNLRRTSANVAALGAGDKLQQNEAPATGDDLVNKTYADTKVADTGDTMTGALIIQHSSGLTTQGTTAGEGKIVLSGPLGAQSVRIYDDTSHANPQTMLDLLQLHFGPGGSGSLDWVMGRTEANVVALGSGDKLQQNASPTVGDDLTNKTYVDAQISSVSSSGNASAIAIADLAGDFTATEVEGALAELQADHETDVQNLATLSTAVDNRIIELTPVSVKTANYSANAQELVPVDTTSNGVEITLPTAPADGTLVGVKLVTVGGSNEASIVCGGSDVFEKTGGSTTKVLSVANQSQILQYYAASDIWYGLAAAEEYAFTSTPLAEVPTGGLIDPSEDMVLMKQSGNIVQCLLEDVTSAGTVGKVGDQEMTGALTILNSDGLTIEDGTVSDGLILLAPGAMATPRISFFGATTDTVAMFRAGADGLAFGPGGSSAVDTTITRSAANTLLVGSGDKIQQTTTPTAGDDLTNKTYVDSGTKTLTNTRITRRSTTQTGNSPTWNSDNCDVLGVTAITGAINVGTNMTLGTHVIGDQLRIELTANGSYAITWGTNFESSGDVILPTTTINGRKDVGFFWNTTTSKWRCVAVV